VIEDKEEEFLCKEEREHDSEFLDSVVLRWDRPHVDLFATSLNHKLETFVSPVPDPLSFAVDAMSLSWDGKFAYERRRISLQRRKRA
jgi:hypothetical protein